MLTVAILGIALRMCHRNCGHVSSCVMGGVGPKRTLCSVPRACRLIGLTAAFQKRLWQRMCSVPVSISLWWRLCVDGRGIMRSVSRMMPQRVVVVELLLWWLLVVVSRLMLHIT